MSNIVVTPHTIEALKSCFDSLVSQQAIISESIQRTNRESITVAVKDGNVNFLTSQILIFEKFITSLEQTQ